MEALALLREYVKRKELALVDLRGSEVVFGDAHVLPRKALTGYRVQGGKGSDFYPLDAVLHLLKNKAQKHVAYQSSARTVGIVPVSLVDRKDLLAYLEGEIASCDALQEPPLELVAAAAKAALADAAETPAAKRPRTDDATGDAAAAAAAPRATGETSLPAGERPLRDRNSVLLCLAHTFDRAVAAAARAAKDMEAAAAASARAANRSAAKPGGPASVGPSRPVPPGPSGVTAAAGGARTGRYQDVQESTFWKNYLKTDEGLTIDPNASFLPAAPRPVAPPSLSRPPPPATTTAAVAPRSVSAPRLRPEAGRPSAGEDKAAAAAVPLILVPSGFATLLNLFNAADFLQHGRFVPWQDARAGGDVRKPSRVEIRRTIGRPKEREGVLYHVIDRPPDKASPDWKRVAAVFVLGAKWQFKDWPFKGAAEGDTVEALHAVRGFFVRYDTDPVPPTVQSWNVHVLTLHKHARHMDAARAMEFWRDVDTALALKKSALKY